MEGPAVENAARAAESAGIAWGWVLLGIVLIAGAVWLFWRMRSRAPVAAAAETPPSPVDATTVALQVHAADATDLKAEQAAFTDALPGREVRGGDCLLFGGIAIHVARVEPRDGATLTSSTVARISKRSEPVEVPCPSCGLRASPTTAYCDGCRAALGVIDLSP
jgi:hypothetical protein